MAVGGKRLAANHINQSSFFVAVYNARLVINDLV